MAEDSTNVSDYSFGKVGQINNYYINNPVKEIAPVSNIQSQTHSSGSNLKRSWGNSYGAGFSDGTFPKGFYPKQTNSTYGEYGYLNDKIWKGWYLKHYASLTDVPSAERETYEANIKNLGTWYWYPGTTQGDYYNYSKMCKMCFKLSEFLPDSVDRNVVDVSSVLLKILFNHSSGYPDSGNLRYQVHYTPYVEGSDIYTGYNAAYSQMVYDYKIKFIDYTETFSDTVITEIPIYPGQEEIVLDIVTFEEESTNTEANWNNIWQQNSNSFGWYYHNISINGIKYIPKVEGNVYTGINQREMFLSSGSANIGDPKFYTKNNPNLDCIQLVSNKDVANFLIEEIEFSNGFNIVWPDSNSISNGKLQVESSTITSLFQSGKDNNIYIFVNWLSGEYYGYYRNSITNQLYKMVYRKDEDETINDGKFSLSKNECIFVFSEISNASTNQSTNFTFVINPSKKQVLKLPAFVDVIGNKATYEVKITNSLQEFSLLDNVSNLLKEIADTRAEISKLKEDARYVNLIFKVGDIWYTFNNENPGIRFGGTWELITDRFLLGTNDNNKIGNESIGTTPKDLAETHFHFSAYNNLTDDEWVLYDTTGQTRDDKPSSYSIPWNAGIGSSGGWSDVSWLNVHTYRGKLLEKSTTTMNPIKTPPDKILPPFIYVYLWKKVSNEKDPALNNFTTNSNYLYRIAADDSAVGTIDLKTISSTTNDTLKQGWLECNGQKVNTVDYQELAEVLGYGTQTTQFSLPLLNYTETNVKVKSLKENLRVQKSETEYAVMEPMGKKENGKFTTNNRYTFGFWNYDTSGYTATGFPYDDTVMNYFFANPKTQYPSSTTGAQRTNSIISGTRGLGRALTPNPASNIFALPESCLTRRFNMFNPIMMHTYEHIQTVQTIIPIKLSNLNYNSNVDLNNISSLNIFYQEGIEVHTNQINPTISTFKIPSTCFDPKDITNDQVDLISSFYYGVTNTDGEVGKIITIPIKENDKIYEDGILKDIQFNLVVEYTVDWYYQSTESALLAVDCNNSEWVILELESVNLLQSAKLAADNVRYYIKAKPSEKSNVKSLSFINENSCFYQFSKNEPVLTKNTTRTVKRGTELFANDVFANINPDTAAKTILSYYCINYQNKTNKTLYKFVFDWRMKTFTFYTDDYESNFNSTTEGKIVPNTPYCPLPTNTDSYLNFDLSGNITALPIMPNCNKVDIFECNTFLV